MAALGDSMTRAFNACCRQGDQLPHSWSTGDGPSDGVTSHYERLLQLTPHIRGNSFNEARSGATVSDLPRQAAVAAGRQVQYVTILIGANDLCAPSADSMTSVEDFTISVNQALAVLDSMRPRPQVFVSSIPDLHQLWNVLHTDPTAQSVWSAGQVCQSMLAAGNTGETRRQVVEREKAFNSILAAACGSYREICRHDGGAVYSYPFSAADVSVLDYFHPSMLGQARLAGITWDAAWEDR